MQVPTFGQESNLRYYTSLSKIYLRLYMQVPTFGQESSLKYYTNLRIIMYDYVCRYQILGKKVAWNITQTLEKLCTIMYVGTNFWARN
jgi:hypothetical protein